MRGKHFDRLLAPGSTSAEIECDMIAAPFDRAVRAADLKWGIDRLMGLVPPDMAMKYGTVLGRFNVALNGADHAVTQRECGILIRGLAAMDAAATDAGHQPANPEFWDVEVDGVICSIIRDDALWPAAAAKLPPGRRIYSLAEVGHALAAYGGMVAAVKDAFPGARVTAVRKPTELEIALDDEIPF